MGPPKIQVPAALLAVLSLNLMSFCWSLNTEGMVLLRFRDGVSRDPFGALVNWNDGGGDNDHCSWFGVECCDGKVVILNLKDLCLEGTLSPELGKLTYLRSIILRNNSFWGKIPKEIGELRKLEVLDLGDNNFSGLFPSEIGNNLSLTTLLLDSEEVLGAPCRDTSIDCIKGRSASYRRLLQKEVPAPTTSKTKKNGNSAPSLAPAPSSVFFISISPSTSVSVPPESSFSPSLSPLSQSPSPSPVLAPTPASEAPEILTASALPEPPSQTNHVPVPAPAPSADQISTSKNSTQKHRVLFISVGVIGGFMIVLLSALGFVFFRHSKVVTVKPWATGLSGQLQKAFVTGVPKLNRAELEAACEDFSNIIGNLSDGTVYKGTLSSGVEIAVTSTTVTSPEDWSKNAEAQFRHKIDTLSKLNHKNFVNLIGFCEEEKPFTRMMVFEYAPSGTLFEHLHVKESEHLDWGMRLRSAMGIAYCLDYMHQLSPPISHRNLNSFSIHLTEDYAAKVSDFSFWNDLTAAKIGTSGMELLETPSPDPESNIHSFGLLLFEMMTGRIPYSMDNGFLVQWVSKYLNGEQSSKDIVDPTLKSFQEDVLKKVFEVVKECLNPDPTQRPRMRELAGRLKEITAVEPEGATPRLSPLWWAELEILSAESAYEEVKL